ncbi:restriction endonuclease [Afipia massiliensis]|uniref:Restriction endonuclease n=1 Tax=Afipia massiliensis TaxID=211460 RepID=A0A4U6BL22_9BRAD|nr:McrC family protein [Afipia massiliensis]TKT70877.1 restriction endonuclease [Afipia massiliensis]
MIRRTVLEWRSLRYGGSEDCIPEWAADRIAAVARSSPLGGEGGARILTHGRRDLRVAQVVGVIAAEGCSLEILPKIDFPGEPDAQKTSGRIRKQLIHMLAAVLDMKIASGAVTDLGWQKENLLEILIGLFARKLADLLRQGMPRRYVDCEEDLSALRGQLNITRQFTALVAHPQKLACRFDALSPDIALNQVMKAAISRLARISRSNENQRRLSELAFAYAEIADVPIPALRWHDLILDRTNERWREIVNLARLLLGGRFQTTSDGKGKGFSLLFEMNTLFEEYVSIMLKRALAGTGLSVTSQGGRLYCLEDVESGERRFMTKPDILIKRGSTVEFVIDTKWKRLSAQIDDSKQGVNQSDIYQMMAYGQIYRCPRLVLLYPHHAELHRSEGVTGSHLVSGSDGRIVMATIDVSTSQDMLTRVRALCDVDFQMSSAADIADVELAATV